MNQAERILQRLQKAGERGVTNRELNNMGIFRYSARIRDLRNDGYSILSYQINKGLWKFVLEEE